MGTKNKIIDKAIELFNQKGVNNISTNIIAKELNISPGNLYYHFKNKEEIIRTIFLKIKNELSYIWKFNINLQSFFTISENLINNIYMVQEKYNFFYLELFSLILKDKKLNEDYKQYFNMEKEKLVLLIEKGISDDIIIKMIHDDIKEFVNNIWFNFEYWPLVVNLLEDDIFSDYTSIRKLKEWLYIQFEPYLTEKGKVIFSDFNN